jgi:hypothetical protein
VGTPAAVHGVEGGHGRWRAPSPGLVPSVMVGTVGSVGMVLTGTRVGSVPPPDYSWWLAIPNGGGPLVATAFYLSVALLIGGWLGVGREAFGNALTTARAWVVLACWGLPFLVGPPLFSRDIYSYIGQGLIGRHGLDPYSVGPSVLGPGTLLSSIASVWRHTASPYGPLFVRATWLVSGLSGHSLMVEVVAFRVLELIGVLLMMVSLPRLARHLGASPGIALWLGVLSPLSLFGFISSGHNDALMVGLTVAGVTLATEGRLSTGVALCALAATVKLPAAAAVVFLVVGCLRAGDAVNRWKEAARAAGVAVVVFVGVTLACGYGWAWLGPGALHVPTELRVFTTPAVSVGTFIFHLLHPLGVPVTNSAVVTVTQAVVGIAAAVVCLWLLATVGRYEVVQSLGLALLVIVVGSPTVWPWYLLWGLVLLAATPAQRSRVLAAVMALAMLLVGPSGSPRLNGYWYIVVTLAVVATTVWLIRDRHWRALLGRRVV